MTAPEDELPEGFTLKLALVDLIPVFFFSASAILLGLRLHNLVFLWGASFCITAGLGKVTWKIILALAKKDLPVFNRQMHILMPIGFFLIIISFFQQPVTITAADLLQMPSFLFFLIGIAGIGCMSYLGFKNSAKDVKANWIEQCINSVAQASFYFGLLFYHF